jgi:hypothetical protein
MIQKKQKRDRSDRPAEANSVLLKDMPDWAKFGKLSKIAEQTTYAEEATESAARLARAQMDASFISEMQEARKSKTTDLFYAAATGEEDSTPDQQIHTVIVHQGKAKDGPQAIQTLVYNLPKEVEDEILTLDSVMNKEDYIKVAFPLHRMATDFATWVLKANNLLAVSIPHGEIGIRRPKSWTLGLDRDPGSEEFPVPDEALYRALGVEDWQVLNISWTVSKKNGKKYGWATVRTTPNEMQRIFKKPVRSVGRWRINLFISNANPSALRGTVGWFTSEVSFEEVAAFIRKENLEGLLEWFYIPYRKDAPANFAHVYFLSEVGYAEAIKRTHASRVRVLPPLEKGPVQKGSMLA